jgi:hypothetical protein
VLVVHALDDLTESSFTDDLDELISECDLVIFLDSVVAFFVIKAVVDKTLELSCLNFLLVFLNKVYVLVFFNFFDFVICQIPLGVIFLFKFSGLHGKTQLFVDLNLVIL